MIVGTASLWICLKVDVSCVQMGVLEVARVCSLLHFFALHFCNVSVDFRPKSIQGITTFKACLATSIFMCRLKTHVLLWYGMIWYGVAWYGMDLE